MILRKLTLGVLVGGVLAGLALTAPSASATVRSDTPVRTRSASVTLAPSKAGRGVVRPPEAGCRTPSGRVVATSYRWVHVHRGRPYGPYVVSVQSNFRPISLRPGDYWIDLAVFCLGAPGAQPVVGQWDSIHVHVGVRAVHKSAKPRVGTGSGREVTRLRHEMNRQRCLSPAEARGIVHGRGHWRHEDHNFNGDSATLWWAGERGARFTRLTVDFYRGPRLAEAGMGRGYCGMFVTVHYPDGHDRYYVKGG